MLRPYGDDDDAPAAMVVDPRIRLYDDAMLTNYLTIALYVQDELRFDPAHPFEYNILGERLDDFYVAERRVGWLVGIAALLAFVIKGGQVVLQPLTKTIFDLRGTVSECQYTP